MRNLEQKIVFTREPILVPEAEANSESGARAEFSGIVRELEQEKKIGGLFYEAYESMARRQLGRIMDELHDETPCHAVLFIHRLGWVPAGEASLYVRITAAHRQEAFAFMTRLIDRLKEDVPIWKSFKWS
jgi:molybdopterin synthase catalytic subunit